MGGMVAQEVVARRPELVSRLVLCGTSPSFGKPDGDWQREFIAAAHRAARRRPDHGASWREMLVPQMVGPRLAARRRAAGDPLHGPGARRHLPARAGGAASPSTGAPTCRTSSVPTLLVAGEHDRNAPPAVMKKMADAIPRSTYIEMQGVGHLQNLEAPDDFDGLLLNFLALPPRAAALNDEQRLPWMHCPPWASRPPSATTRFTPQAALAAGAGQ